MQCTAEKTLTAAQLALIGDFDNSGTVTNGDIQGLLDYVASLGGGTVESVPEPAGFVLLCVGLFMIALSSQRRSFRRIC